MSDFSTFISSFLVIAIPYVAALVSPGPDMVMIMRNSLMYSKKSGLLAALGVATGMMMHATYTLLGLGIIIKESLFLFNLIRGAGALYLIYIGWKSFRAPAPAVDGLNCAHKPDDLTTLQAFKTGFLSNALNPMVIVFFITILSSIMDFTIPPLAQGMYVIMMGLLTFSWFATVATLLTLPTVRDQFIKLGKWIGRITGGVLISFGFKGLFLLSKGF